MNEDVKNINELPDDVGSSSQESDDVDEYGEIKQMFIEKSNELRKDIEYQSKWLGENPDYHDRNHYDSIREDVESKKLELEKYQCYIKDPRKYFEDERKKASICGHIFDGVAGVLTSSMGVDFPETDVFYNTGVTAYFCKDALKNKSESMVEVGAYLFDSRSKQSDVNFPEYEVAVVRSATEMGLDDLVIGNGNIIEGDDPTQFSKDLMRDLCKDFDKQVSDDPDLDDSVNIERNESTLKVQEQKELDDKIRNMDDTSECDNDGCGLIEKKDELDDLSDADTTIEEKLDLEVKPEQIETNVEQLGDSEVSTTLECRDSDDISDSRPDEEK